MSAHKSAKTIGIGASARFNGLMLEIAINIGGQRKYRRVTLRRSFAHRTRDDMTEIAGQLSLQSRTSRLSRGGYVFDIGRGHRATHRDGIVVQHGAL